MAESVLYDSVKPVKVHIVTRNGDAREYPDVTRAAIFNIGQQAFLRLVSTIRYRRPYSTAHHTIPQVVVLNMAGIYAVHVEYPEADNLTQDAPDTAEDNADAPNKSECTGPDCPIHGPGGIFVAFGISGD